MIQKIINKYSELIKYGIFGVITVGINLFLYDIFLKLNIYYVISSIVSYLIASFISYYFNVYLVFSADKLNFKEEIIRILKYFSVRIGSMILDTLLLIVAVELLSMDEFYAKIIISILIILITFILNKKILKK